MARLETPLKEEVETLREKSLTEIINGNRFEAIKLLEKAWGLLPEPKYIYSDSFQIAKSMITIYLLLHDYVNGRKWADIIIHCDLDRIDDGERELLAGRAAYESDDLQAAENLFFTAHQKSKGRLFENKKYQRYLTLLRRKFKEGNMDTL